MKNILVLCATKLELPLVPKSIPVHTIGVGSTLAEKYAQQYIQEYKPELVLLCGLAGAVDSSLCVNDMFIPETILSSQNHSTSYTTVNLVQRKGVLVTVPKVFRQREKLDLLIKIPQTTAVDMEASFVAKAAEQHNIPFLCIKSISDNLGFDLDNTKELMTAVRSAAAASSKFVCTLLTKTFHVPD